MYSDRIAKTKILLSYRSSNYSDIKRKIIDFCRKDTLVSEEAKRNAISYMLGSTCYAIHQALIEDDECEPVGLPHIVNVYFSDEAGIYVLMSYDTGESYLYLNPMDEFNTVEIPDYMDTKRKLEKAFTLFS